MNIEMKLTVPAVAMTGIGGGVWPVFSHKVCTFSFDKSIILVINAKNM